MRVSIDIDDNLRHAMRVGGADTKKATVETAHRLLIQTRTQAGMRRFRGKVKWEGNRDVSRRGRVPPAPQSKRKRKASLLDVEGVKLGVPTTDLVAIVREGRERG